MGIGEAEALQDQRTRVANADARAVEGENEAKIQVAGSDSLRRQREAEAERTAIAAEKVQKAKALEEAYAAEKESELARAERVRAFQKAEIVVPAQIVKKKAEAQGVYEILTKQAEGLDQIVKAAGNNPKDAAMLLIADKLPELVKIQAEAIKNIKIDKVTVWDGGNGGQGKDGKTSTANFLSGLYQSVPPLQDMFNMAGMELPEYLKGKDVTEDQQHKEADDSEGPSDTER